MVTIFSTIQYKPEKIYIIGQKYTIFICIKIYILYTSAVRVPNFKGKIATISCLVESILLSMGIS